jgi:hypothetical protein
MFGKDYSAALVLDRVWGAECPEFSHPGEVCRAIICYIYYSCLCIILLGYRVI